MIDIIFSIVVLGLLVCLYRGALANGCILPRLTWQSPRMYRYGGIYLKYGNKRWRILQVGPT